MNRLFTTRSQPNELVPSAGLFRRRYGSTAQHWRRWLRWLAVFAVFAIVHDYALLGGGLAGDEARAAGDSAPSAPGEDETETPKKDAHPDHAGGGHADPVAPVLLAIVLILLAAKIGGDVFERMGMPAVLGELSIGVVIGNFALLTGGVAYFFTGSLDGSHVFVFLDAPDEGVAGDPYQAGAIIKILAGIGVVLLLFEVGLETSVREMMSVGLSSCLVAILGVVAPMALGYAVTVIVTDYGWSDWEVPAFIGATLCATSVGITARVLKDLGRAQQKESKIILGAAVIDDVLGLMVLAIIVGLIKANWSETGESNGLGLEVVKIVGLAVGFIIGALVLGRISFTRYVFRAASHLRGHGLLVTTALVICFGFSWFANVVGLAPIVGAFAAGLILEGSHYKELGKRENHSLEDALAPVAALLVPIFFVQMGIQVDLASFADPSVWLLAGAITVVAIIGKQVCSFGVREKGLNRMAVGLGMIPRGEVGLIFANEGAKLIADGERVINDGTYSAVVVMVMITTMVTPPLLKWSLNRGDTAANVK